MKWKLIDTGKQTGKFNMDFDIELTSKSEDDEIFFRLYQWQPYCISLGYHQPESDIDRESAEADDIDIVRRPTGGRAILHSEEITYSVVFPTHAGFAPKEIYERVSKALIAGLGIYDSRLKMLSLESVQPNFPALLKSESGMLCFASTAKNEVKYRHKKVIGSAQRKIKNRILQHGSIMCGNYHLNLAKYSSGDDASKQSLKNELNKKTISIGDILESEVDYSALKESLVSGMQLEFGIQFEQVSRLSAYSESLSF